MATVINGNTGIDKVQDDAVNPVTDIASGIPCFSAYSLSPQSVTLNTWTKVTFNTKEFDTTNAYNTTGTDYTFKPNVAGCYEVSGSIFVATTNTPMAISLFKNNAIYKYMNRTLSATDGICGGGIIVYLDGVNDYVDLRAYIGATQNLSTGIAQVYFQAHLIVGA